MKKASSIIALIICSCAMQAQIYTAKPGATTISFFSSAPLEDIEAVNNSAMVVFRSTTSDIQLSISIIGFKFKNALMGEHFNENYMESDKYPKCVFKGKINETVDYTKEGETSVTVSGKMELHGVTKDVTFPAKITKMGQELKLYAKFKIKVADYNIKVPSMYVKNIAEEVEVTFQTTVEPFTNKK